MRCLIRYAWKKQLHKRLLNRMTVRIQCLARCIYAQQRLRHLRRVRSTSIIQRWYSKCRAAYRLKSAVRIQRFILENSYSVYLP